ncbi:MAG: hypothetical protein N2379_06605 [Verrucomicrobiae bacterium]|nr:hypothetical protein [Verrucomicrobiae bacterium]
MAARQTGTDVFPELMKAYRLVELFFLWAVEDIVAERALSEWP